MVRSHIEVERKFDASAEVELPDLTALPGVDHVGAPERVDLAAVYLDTVGLTLTGAGITLRRRTGGGEDGWHLKLPRGDRGRAARLELQVPLEEQDESSSQVPGALLDQVLALTRAAPLVPVATITTTRTRRLLHGADGTVLAEVADDRVEGRASAGPATGRTLRWREVEVELVDGPSDLLDATDLPFTAAGLHLSDASSKLHRVLGVAPAPTAADREPPRRGTDSGTVLVAFVDAQVRRVAGLDPLVRDPSAATHEDAVHQMRVAVRRLRSALSTYRPLVVRERTDPVRAELGWIGGLLGDVRDVQVLRTHLVATIDRLDPALVSGPVRARVSRELAAREADAHEHLLVALRSDRYLALLDDLDLLVTDPPFTSRAARPARPRLPARVDREWMRVLDRHRDVRRASSAGADLDSALHELRKAAKRGRYAAEVLIPVHGSDARRFARAMTAVQQTLGDHHDTVVARETLLALAVSARAAGEDTFTYGLLHGLEAMRAEDASSAYLAAWEQADRRKLRRWLS